MGRLQTLRANWTSRDTLELVVLFVAASVVSWLLRSDLLLWPSIAAAGGVKLGDVALRASRRTHDPEVVTETGKR